MALDLFRKLNKIVHYLKDKDRIAVSREKLFRENKTFFPSINSFNKTIDGVKIEPLLNKYGSPLFVVSQRALMEKCSYLSKLLEDILPNAQIAYSIKTNNISKICSFFKQQGFLGEVVSNYEYWLAKKLGYRDSEIIFNGPSKLYDIKTFEKALLNGAKVHLDNEEELLKALTIANSHKKHFSVGIRLAIGYHGNPSRFGFSVQDNSAINACLAIKRNKYIHLNGIQFHIGSNVDDINYFRNAVGKACKLIIAVEKLGYGKIEYLDVGGGFPSVGGGAFDNTAYPYETKQYFTAIAQPLKQYNLHNKLQLIIEPGRLLVDEAIVIISKVLHSKETLAEKQITVDASLSIMPLAQTRLQNIIIIPYRNCINKQQNQLKKTTIYGSSCVEIDWLARGQYRRLYPNDLIAFFNAGAYNISQSNQFVFPKPAVIMINSVGRAKLLRSPETFGDVSRQDRT